MCRSKPQSATVKKIQYRLANRSNTNTYMYMYIIPLLVSVYTMIISIIIVHVTHIRDIGIDVVYSGSEVDAFLVADIFHHGLGDLVDVKRRFFCQLQTQLPLLCVLNTFKNDMLAMTCVPFIILVFDTHKSLHAVPLIVQ